MCDHLSTTPPIDNSQVVELDTALGGPGRRKFSHDGGVDTELILVFCVSRRLMAQEPGGRVPRGLLSGVQCGGGAVALILSRLDTRARRHTESDKGAPDRIDRGERK